MEQAIAEFDAKLAEMLGEPEGATVGENERAKSVSHHVKCDNDAADVTNDKVDNNVKEKLHHHPQETPERCAGAVVQLTTEKEQGKTKSGGRESSGAHEALETHSDQCANDDDEGVHERNPVCTKKTLQALRAGHPHRAKLEATLKRLQGSVQQHQQDKKDLDDNTPDHHIIQGFLAEQVRLLLIQRDKQLRLHKVNPKEVKSWAFRKGFRTLPKYQDDIDELTNHQWWYKIKCKTAVTDVSVTKKEQQEPSLTMKDALKRCHAMENIDFERRIARQYTHGTTARSNIDSTHEAMSHLLFSNSVIEVAYLKEVSGFAAPLQTFYFCSNTQMPSKEAIYRDSKCTSIDTGMTVTVPYDPESTKGKFLYNRSQD